MTALIVVLSMSCVAGMPTLQEAVGQATFMSIEPKEVKVHRWGNDLNPMSRTTLRREVPPSMFSDRVIERLRAEGFVVLPSGRDALLVETLAGWEHYQVLRGGEILTQTPIFLGVCSGVA